MKIHSLPILADRAAANVNDGLWSLAFLAARAKRDALPGWAETIAARPAIRKSPRTVREWAQTAEFRQLAPKKFDLPFSFYARAARYLDRLDIEDIFDAMQTAESNREIDLDGFTAALARLCVDYQPRPVTLPIWKLTDETVQRLISQDRDTRIVILDGFAADVVEVKVRAVKNKNSKP